MHCLKYCSLVDNSNYHNSFILAVYNRCKCASYHAPVVLVVSCAIQKHEIQLCMLSFPCLWSHCFRDVISPHHRGRNRWAGGTIAPPIFLEGGLSPPNILGRGAEPPIFSSSAVKGSAFLLFFPFPFSLS